MASPLPSPYSTMHSVPTLFFLAVWPHVLYHALCTDFILSGRVATHTLPCTLYRLYSLWPCGHTYSTMHSVPTLFFLATYSTMHSVPTLFSLAVWPHVLYHALCTDSILSGHVLYHALCTDSILSGRVHGQKK